MIPELRLFKYEDRLKILKLKTLEIRRLRGDLIQVFKILKEFESAVLIGQNAVDSLKLLGSVSAIRGNQMRIKRKILPHCLPRNHFFSNRMVYAWNSLPSRCIEPVSINTFKANTDNMDIVDLRKVLDDMKKLKTLY